MKENILFFLGFIIVAVIILAGMMYLAATTCEARWAESGYPSRWEPFAGCRILVDGRWVPDRTLRNLNQ